MQTGNKFRFKYRIKGRDGSLRWHACHGAPVRNSQGTIESWTCALSDVHEDTEARHDALLVKERTKAVLEGSGAFPPCDSLGSETPQADQRDRGP